METKNFVIPSFEKEEENEAGFLALKNDYSEFRKFEFIQSGVADERFGSRTNRQYSNLSSAKRYFSSLGLNIVFSVNDPNYI